MNRWHSGKLTSQIRYGTLERDPPPGLGFPNLSPITDVNVNLYDWVNKLLHQPNSLVQSDTSVLDLHQGAHMDSNVFLTHCIDMCKKMLSDLEFVKRHITTLPAEHLDIEVLDLCPSTKPIMRYCKEHTIPFYLTFHSVLYIINDIRPFSLNLSLKNWSFCELKKTDSDCCGFSCPLNNWARACW